MARNIPYAYALADWVRASQILIFSSGGGAHCTTRCYWALLWNRERFEHNGNCRRRLKPYPLRMPSQRISPATRAANFAYAKSNAATKIPVHPSLRAREAAKKLLAASENPAERQRLGQEVLDALCTTARIPMCPLIVLDTPQEHTLAQGRLESKTYGDYAAMANRTKVSNQRIRIFNRTAILRQPLSVKVFLYTLLHEWCHHHDLAGLHLGKTMHTRGFYTRLQLLSDEFFVG